ncbi:unnamed protein product [Rotaria socialis]|uniref:Uncharacterized protein n=1 Tax=Rotaria socialis TaxID=392032 RepID=A0A818HS18_9BILA|nr:unnamed protein product [Rotaria socialis]CAF3343229.1 unnamed protein product [Rotaria socialis]CAF3512480.1 unnamed protein product [Rotaria socialis]CAF3752550.1 unnamed protein product [Rotaria socialis]CAF4304295.1 unnamed protein product [Rotaria socialis]
MAATKRFRQRTLADNENFPISTSVFMEKFLKPTIEVEQKNTLNDMSKLMCDDFGILSKMTTDNQHTNENIAQTIIDKTQSTSDDDWVCPVAVVLRRAGYDVPLRPSKSWLERDRKKQASLRERRASFTKT